MVNKSIDHVVAFDLLLPHQVPLNQQGLWPRILPARVEILSHNTA